MYNAYNPYGDFKSDITNIIEQEKKVNEDRKSEYAEKKRRLIPLDMDNNIDFNYIFEQMTFVLSSTFVDLFEKQDIKSVFSRERWTGLGYIFIAVYIAYFISKL
jgi:hypothetical protein